MEPDWERLPAEVPARIRQVLRACLQKNAKQRIGDVQDVRLALEGAFETAAPPAAAAAHLASPGTHPAWMAFAAAVLVAAALAIPTVRHLREAPPEELSLQLSVPLPANSQTGFLEMSADSRRLVIDIFRGGKSQLYLRSLDSPELQPLGGTDNARAPFWSPDSRFIGFFAEGALKVIPAAGGPARVLCSETGLGQGGGVESERRHPVRERQWTAAARGCVWWPVRRGGERRSKEFGPAPRLSAGRQPLLLRGRDAGRRRFTRSLFGRAGRSHPTQDTGGQFGGGLRVAGGRWARASAVSARHHADGAAFR